MASVRSTNPADEIDAILGSSDSLDGPAFDVVYRYYERQLTHFAHQLNSRDPEGVAHLALFDGYRAFARNPIRTEAQFRAYLYRAAKSHTIGEHRKQVPVAATISDGVLATDDGADTRATEAWLGGLVDELPHEQRRVIKSRFVDDKTAEETGNELGKSANAVHQLQHRAISNLRRVALASMLAALVVVAILGWRQWSSDRSFLLNAPADPTPQIDDGPAEDPTETIESQAGTTIPETPAVEGETVDGETVDQQPPVDEEADETTQPTTPEPVAEEEPETPSTTTVAETELLPGLMVRPSVLMNGCRTVDLGQGKTAVIFYEPAIAVAAGFRPPEAIRFLDTSAQPVAEADASLPSVPGLSHNAHGWLKLDGENTTVASEAPTSDQTDGWGVIYDQTKVTGEWATVEFFAVADGGDTGWFRIDGCTP